MSSKQDRIGARTPMDLERKYNLGGALGNGDNSNKSQAEKINQLNQTLSQFMAYVSGKLEEMDTNTQTWFYSGTPTLENAPAVNWTTDELKAKHIGDQYYNTDDGCLYLFKQTVTDAEVTYEWVACNTGTMYKITFYNANKEVMAFYSVKKETAISSPVSDAVWVDSAGNTITFPYTPTSDMDLYISS